MNARGALLANVTAIAKARGKTWDDVLRRLDAGAGRGRSWLSMLRTGQRVKFLTLLDEIASELGVPVADLFRVSADRPALQSSPQSADDRTRESDDEEGMGVGIRGGGYLVQIREWWDELSDDDQFTIMSFARARRFGERERRKTGTEHEGNE